MRKNNILKDKSFSFAIRIINLYKDISINKKEFVLSKQVLRSGTSVGALIRESENAAGKRDFLNKSNVALKEADETQYWLELLFHTEYISPDVFNTVNSDCNEIISILIASIKTLKTALHSPF